MPKKNGLPAITRKQLIEEASKVLEEVETEKAAEFLVALALSTLHRRSSNRAVFTRRALALSKSMEQQYQDML